MSLSSAELAMQLTMTEAFILADATEVVFQRSVKTDDKAGGFTNKREALDTPQTVRLIPQTDKVLVIPSADGEKSRPEMVLMGMPSLDIKRYDIFEFQGDKWRVEQIHTHPEYEIKADVVRYVG